MLRATGKTCYQSYGFYFFKNCYKKIVRFIYFFFFKKKKPEVFKRQT